ncbi:HNH endonuclease [Xanthomonas campestris]|uniref:HNH endonuclease n=1 Tax=Xanthomonas campestris TaxID=339 RepID=UPI001E2A540E|nr:HNH endonuclease [Xanthomonas campestris]MCC4605889.1 HNH endonuclease [Xanthomonas campestris pv. parthenii]
MSVCSYCDKEKPATREHIIPSWYYKHEPNSEDTGFMERAKGKIVKTELVIRDVCGDCNNNVLSDLDSYGKNLFFKYLINYVYKDTKTEFHYDYEQLARWLLKISYNSARSHDSDTEILTQYRRIITGDEPLPDHLIIKLLTIAPAIGGVYSVTPAFKDANAVSHPDWFRVGVFRIEDFDTMYWAFRHVTINSYSFLLYVPDLSTSSRALDELQALQLAVSKERKLTTISRAGVIDVPTPEIDSISYNMNHLGNFPFAYGLIKNETIEAAMEKKFGLVNYWIDRADIENKDISNVLAFLNDLVSSREICMGMKERIEISVHGYDEDLRELYEIPEVVTFLKALDDEWPYWMLFQHPNFQWLQILAVCLSEPKSNGFGKFEFNPELISNCMNKWFISLNEICHKHAISLTVNKRVSAQAGAIITKGLVE